MRRFGGAVRRVFGSMRCCLNPKVIGVLAATGLLLWLVAPASGAAAVPLLIVLICPLSMGAMAWRMTRGGNCATTGQASAPAAGSEDVDAELRELREEIAIERARRQLATRDDRPLG